MSTINIRADRKLKHEANKVFKNLGLDMSSAIKVFLRQVVITKSIPFQLRTENGLTSAQEEALLKESAELKNSLEIIEKFQSSEELHKSILNEEELSNS